MADLVKANLNGLDELYLPKHRAERPDWYTGQGWEKQRHKSMKDNIGKGDVVYYVGAEEGEFPALCQKWGAEVVLFEPNPAVWSHYPVIWKANKLDDPLGFYGGFASNKTTSNASVSFDDIASVEIEGAHGFKELYLEADNYPQVKIDDYVKNSKPPTAISIDVEGSEFEVLKGAEQVIKKYRPKIWLSLHPEFLFHQWGLYGRDVRNWLMDRGYKEQLLEYEHEVHLYYD